MHLYNRTKIGELPVIPNDTFKELAEKVANGLSKEEIVKYKEQYSFEQNQQNLINFLYKAARSKVLKVEVEKKPFTPFLKDVQLEDKIWFGKHKGKRIVDLIIENPKYIDWCMQNIERFHLSKEAFDFLLLNEKK